MPISQPTVPFSEPPWLSNPPSPSPYFTSSHRSFQAAIRAFITTNLHDHALEWDTQGRVPEEAFKMFAEANMLVPSLPAPLPVEVLKSLGLGGLLGGVSVEEFDGLHGLIYGDEMAASGVLGPSASLTTGFAYGIPPIIRFGNQQLKDRVLPDLLLGRKRTCLAITEPGAGSDVASIETTAGKSEDGMYYIVSGMKKWITNGLVADYATMAVRTGPLGPAGISLLLVPLKDDPSIAIRPILTTSSTANNATSGTAFITLTSAHIPTTNLIGHENQGLSYILSNFTHERLTIAIGATRQARVALSEAIAYCMRREAFGKPLMEQPVVRHRLAKAGALLESLSAWIESVAFQASQNQKQKASGSPDDRNSALSLGGTAALVKAQAGIVLDECARCALLLFGGNGLTRTGVGEIVSKIYRDAPSMRVPGGSEDVLLDLGVRQLIKVFRAQKSKLERETSAKI